MSLALFAVNGANAATAGHGDADDAAICVLVSDDRPEKVSPIGNRLENEDQAKPNLLGFWKAPMTSELWSVLVQDFEMRLCECRAYGDRSNAELAADQSQKASMNVAGELPATHSTDTTDMILSLDVVSQPFRSTQAYRFTREDFSTVQMRPFGSFVSKLTIEEYRPYDLMDVQLDKQALNNASSLDDIREVPLENDMRSEALRDEELIWATRDCENATPYISDIQAKRALASQKLTAFANSMNGWIHRAQSLVESKFADQISYSISNVETFFTRSKDVLVAFSKSPLFINSMQVAVSKTWAQSQDRVHTKNFEPSNRSMLTRSDLQKVFGTTVLCNPIDMDRLTIRNRPPMLVDPLNGEELWSPSFAGPEKPVNDSAELKWKLIVYLQEPSWKFSETGMDAREPGSAVPNGEASRSKEMNDFGAAEGAPEVSTENLDERPATSPDGDLVENNQPELPTKSASLTENVGHIVSQR